MYNKLNITGYLYDKTIKLFGYTVLQILIVLMIICIIHLYSLYIS